MHDDAAGREGGGIFGPELRAASSAILTTVALSAFEGLAVAAALPQLAADLGQVDLLPWVISAYLLTSGVSTIAAGALVDRLGVARVFRWAVVVFVLGGVLAGVAPGMDLLVAARVLQGIGAGAVTAVGLSAVGLVFPSRLVGRAFAANSTVWGLMSVASPAIAAGLLAVASWRWIFLLNLPLGGLALLVGWRALPSDPPRHRRAAGQPPIRLDPLVLVLLTLVTSGLLVAVDQLGWRSLPAAAVTAVAGAVLLRRERGRPGALIAPRHVVDAPLGPLGWTMALLLTGSIGLATYVPLLLSAGRGVGTALTAWSVVFFTLGWTAGANLSSRLMDRRAPLQVTRIGTLLAPLSVLAVAGAVAVDAPLPVLLVPVVLAGTGTGMSTNSALTLLRSLAPSEEIGRATAAHQFLRNIGFAVGNALFGAVVLLVVARTTGEVEVVREALAEGGAAGTAGAAVAGAVRDGFAAAAAIGAGVALLAQLPLRRVARAAAAEDSTAAPTG